MSTASSSEHTTPNTGGSIQMLGGLDLCAIEKWDWNTRKLINAVTDQSNRTITFGVDTAVSACRTVLLGNHAGSPRVSCALGSRSRSALLHSWQVRSLGRRSTSIGGKASDRRTGYDRVTTGDGATTTDGCKIRWPRRVNGCALVQTEALCTRLQRAE